MTESCLTSDARGVVALVAPTENASPTLPPTNTVRDQMLNNSALSNSAFANTTGCIPVMTEDERMANFSSINLEIPRSVEGTSIPFLSPEVISVVKKKVEEQYKLLTLKRDNSLSSKENGDEIFSISLADKVFGIVEHSPAGIGTVTLAGTPEMVLFGQECVEHFVNQAQVWSSLLAITELDESSRCDISLQVSLAICPLQSQIIIHELEEYYANLGKTNGVWITSLSIGTELHFILGDVLSEKGACLLKVDGAWVQNSNDVEVVCNEATLMGNDTVEVTFRFPANVDLSKIRGEYAIEKTHVELKDGDGNRSPPPSPESDDPLSGYMSFITKFKAVPTMEFNGLCVASVRTSMWNQHKLIYGSSCDAECPCASILTVICDTVRSDFHTKYAPKTERGSGGNAGFLENFYSSYYPKIGKQFPGLRPQEVYDKVVALWSCHQENPAYGPYCHARCPCVNAWQSYFQKQLLMLQERHHLVNRTQGKVHPVLCRNPKYSLAHDPHPAVSDIVERSNGKSLKNVILKNFDEKLSSKEEQKKRVQFKKIEGDNEAATPRGCITQIDNIPVSPADIEVEKCDEASDFDKYSISSFFSRRSNSDLWIESKEKKDAFRGSHAWNPIEETKFVCSKCKVSKGKFLCCMLCGSCLNCGSKLPCDDSDPDHPKKGRLSSYDLVYLLRRRYEGALLAAFGYSAVKTVSLRDLSDRTVDKDADIYKIKSNEQSYCRDFCRVMELIDLEPGFLNSPLSSSVVDVDNVDVPKELFGRTILFAAAMHSTYDTVLHLLQRGSDARHRDGSHKRASDVVKERREKLINRMKQIWTGEVTPISGEEETLKTEIKDVETTSKVLQIFLIGERLVNLSSGVKCWSLVQVKILQAHNLCFSSQMLTSSAPDLLFCAATWDGRQLNHISTVEPLSQNPDWSKSMPYQFRFNGAVTSTFTGKRLVVQLIKGDPNSRDNFQLSTWESSGEELNGIAVSKAISGTFALPISPFLESGYVSIEIQRLSYDREYEEKVKVTQSNELSALISLVESLRSENADLQINLHSLHIPTAKNLSLLHAAIYLENVDLVKRLINNGAKLTSDVPGNSPLELSKSLNQKYPNKCNSEVLSAINSCIISRRPSTEYVCVSADHPNSDKSDEENSDQLISNFGAPVLPIAAGNPGSIKSCDREDQQSADAPEDMSYLPLLPISDWMLCRVSKKERCERFNTKGGCKTGSLCQAAHIYCSTQPNKDRTPRSDELYNAYLHRFDVKLKMSDFYVLSETGGDGVLYYTGALVCPVSKVIYYAKGGPSECRDEQGVHWYRSKRDAKVAMSSVLLSALDDHGHTKNNDAEAYVSDTVVQQTVLDEAHSKGPSPRPIDPTTAKGTIVVAPSSAINSCALPKLKNVEWMLEIVKKKEICRYFKSNNGCDKKAMCYFAHIHTPRDSVNESNTLPLEKLFLSYDKLFQTKLTLSSFYEAAHTCEEGKVWFVGGFVCPIESTIYYTRGGPSSHINEQRLFLYPTRQDARAAVAGEVLDAFRRRSMMPSETPPREKSPAKKASSRSILDKSVTGSHMLPSPMSQAPIDDDDLYSDIDTVSKAFVAVNGATSGVACSGSSGGVIRLPFLSRTDWMLEFPKIKTCINFSRNNACGHGKRCGFAHIHDGEHLKPDTAVNQETLALAYQTKFQHKLMSDVKFMTKSETSDEVEWFTAAFLCPVKEIIYVATGCEQSYCSSQGLFWYRSVEAAKCAASAVVVQALKQLDDFLPILHNPMWMLETIGAKNNCRDFNLNETCSKGSQCGFAHIYTPKVAVPSVTPDSSYALWNCYKDNFSVSLKNSSFFEKSAVDKRGKTWYTGALRCPEENIIYCAEGGKGFKVSEQNVFWYSSIKEARAAVSTVVLMALSARGFKCEWGTDAFAHNKTSNLSQDDISQQVAGSKNNASLSNLSPVGEKHKRELEHGDKGDSSKKMCFNENVNDLLSLPLLDKVDWMLKEPKARQCFAFERDHACLLGKSCGNGHVHRLKTLPSSEVKYSRLLNLYKAMFGSDLTNSNILTKEEIDIYGKKWITGCMVCPVDQTIYNAAGGRNGHKNSQGIYFYRSTEDMLDALAGVCFHVMADRPEMLPSLPEGEWMLEATKAAHTCKYFPGCVRMEKCNFAHIYKGRDPDSTQVIENDSLLKIYKLKFQKTIKKKSYFEKVAKDKSGRSVYTGALRCPVERTIYYARGMGGIASTQNIYWYTSKEAAKIAVTAVIISALAAADTEGSATKRLPSSVAPIPSLFIVNKNECLNECDIKLPKASQPEVDTSSDSNMTSGYKRLLDRKANDSVKKRRTEGKAGADESPLTKPYENFMTKASPSIPQENECGSIMMSSLATCAKPTGCLFDHGRTCSLSSAQKATRTSVDIHSANHDSLPSNWMEDDFTARCTEYLKYQQCSLGGTCSKAHVHCPSIAIITSPPEFDRLSKIYNFIFGTPLNKRHIRCKFSTDIDGKTWFTAGLRCPGENINYYAEMCTGGVKTPRTNVHWYSDIESAQRAVRAVLFTSLTERGFLKRTDSSGGQALPSKDTSASPTSISSRRVNAFNIPVSSSCSALSCVSNATVASKHQPVPHGSNSPAGTGTVAPTANYQLAYLKIFPKNNLPNTCFTYVEKHVAGKEYYTALFSSPAEKGALYCSCNYDSGGIFEDGKWWYEDQKAAKAAAFHSFLQEMINRGFILDFNRDNSGNRFY